jgi:hypothetical protein
VFIQRSAYLLKRILPVAAVVKAPDYFEARKIADDL